MTFIPQPGLVLRGIDTPLRRADFKLVAFDMDSTLINIECIDEIADAVGKKAEVAAITEATMRGEIADFLGPTIETVSRQLTKLRTDGLIQLENSRHVLIHDLHRLARRAGD